MGQKENKQYINKKGNPCTNVGLARRRPLSKGKKHQGDARALIHLMVRTHVSVTHWNSHLFPYTLEFTLVTHSFCYTLEFTLVAHLFCYTLELTLVFRSVIPTFRLHTRSHVMSQQTFYYSVHKIGPSLSVWPLTHTRQ